MIINRRAVLASTLVTTSSVALASCAQPETSQTTPPVGSEEGVPEGSSSEVLVGNIDEIPVGTGVKVKVNDELTILVTHPKEANFRAFSQPAPTPAVLSVVFRRDKLPAPAMVHDSTWIQANRNKVQQKVP